MLRDVKYVHEEGLKFVFEAISGMFSIWLKILKMICVPVVWCQ
jgi:hypothetical protein